MLAPSSFPPEPIPRLSPSLVTSRRVTSQRVAELPVPGSPAQPNSPGVGAQLSTLNASEGGQRGSQTRGHLVLHLKRHFEIVTFSNPTAPFEQTRIGSLNHRGSAQIWFRVAIYLSRASISDVLPRGASKPLPCCLRPRGLVYIAPKSLPRKISHAD